MVSYREEKVEPRPSDVVVFQGRYENMDVLDILDILVLLPLVAHPDGDFGHFDADE